MAYQQALTTQLPNLLASLRKGEINAIEYGDPFLPGGFLSLLRIRSIPTLSGQQLAIKELHFGGEGSGVYFDMEDDAGILVQLTRMLERYHTPNPILQRLRAQRRNSQKDATLSFYAVQ